MTDEKIIQRRTGFVIVLDSSSPLHTMCVFLVSLTSKVFYTTGTSLRKAAPSPFSFLYNPTTVILTSGIVTINLGDFCCYFHARKPKIYEAYSCPKPALPQVYKHQCIYLTVCPLVSSNKFYCYLSHILYSED